MLTTSEWPLARLWDELLRVEQIGRATDLPNRHLQIFLDRIAHLATLHDSHLLDESFAGLLDPAEARIAASGLADVLGPARRRSDPDRFKRSA